MPQGPGYRRGFTPYHVEAPPIRAGRTGGQPEGNLRKPRPSGRSTGFTLLETMIAMALFASGTLAILELIQRSHVGASDGENVLIATHLAQRRMEELRRVAYASLADESQAAVDDPSGLTRFQREVTVTTPYTNLAQVVVRVYWTAPGGDTNVSLQTYRAAN